MSFSGIRPKFVEILSRGPVTIDSLVNVPIINWSIKASKRTTEATKRTTEATRSVYDDVVYHFRDQWEDAQRNFKGPRLYRLFRAYITYDRDNEGPPRE